MCLREYSSAQLDKNLVVDALWAPSQVKEHVKVPPQPLVIDIHHAFAARTRDRQWQYLAGVTGETRGRRLLAAARGPRGRSGAGPSVDGARLDAPATAVTRLLRASEKIDGGTWQG
jgi:hypothetical protein